MVKRLFIVCLTLSFVLNVSAAKLIFVDQTTGSDVNDGSTWEAAKATITSALNAVSDETTIHVKIGLYQENELIIPAKVTLIGGYDLSLTGVDISKKYYPGENLYYTKLDGSGSHRVLTVKTSGRIEGCVIQAGFSETKGGGIFLDGGTAVYCLIQYNGASNQELTAIGGGVYIQNNGSLVNCVVAYNEANNGPAVAGSNGSLVNNTITQNEAISCHTCGILMDKRSNEENFYHTLKINNQCWFRENLRTAYKPDGSATITNTAYSASDFVYSRKYGRGYTWTVAMNGSTISTTNPSNVQGLCPNGWHLPSKAEFNDLTTYLSSQTDYWCNGTSTNIAKSLASTEKWNTNTTACAVGNSQTSNNSSYFAAYPIYGSSTVGTYAYFVTTDVNNTVFYIQNTSVVVPTYKTYSSQSTIRCVKD